MTGDAGIHLIARVVDEMKHLWHPTVAPDSGIDGQIELRDPLTEEVKNVRIGVQSKATTGTWDRETESGFTYRPKPRDVSYWLSSNQPVLLVCSRGKEAYWRSVQEWARDPKQLAKGYLRFDKEKDRFDATAGSRLFDLRASSHDWTEPANPEPIRERLTTNLMPLRWLTDTVHSVKVPAGTPAEVLAPAWDSEAHVPVGTLRKGRFWTFETLEADFLQVVRGKDPSSQEIGEMLAGEDLQQTNLLKELVVRSAVGRHRRLRWHALKRVAYFARHRDQVDVQHSWREGAPRTVVSARFSSESDHHFTGYRHDAAALTVRELEDSWALQIVPTYLFTWDGKQLSGHHDKALSGIKRLDKHRAVSSSVRMWEELFLRRPGLLDDPDNRQPFELEPLRAVSVPTSFRDEDWAHLSQADAEDAQGSFFEAGDLGT